jgi:hypothetical protein
MVDDIKQITSDAYKTQAKVKEIELLIEQTQSVLKKITEDQSIFLDNEIAITHNYNLSQQIGKLEALKQQELFAFFGEVRKLCDEEQLVQFEIIIKRAVQKRGQRPPRRGVGLERPPLHKKQ